MIPAELISGARFKRQNKAASPLSRPVHPFGFPFNCIMGLEKEKGRQRQVLD